MRDTTPQALDPDEPGQTEPNGMPTVLHAPRQSYESPVRKWKEDPLLWLLRRVEKMPVNLPELSDSIAMEPTGISRRLGL